MKICYSLEDVKKLVNEHAEDILKLTADQVNAGSHLVTTVRDKYSSDFIEVMLIEESTEYKKEIT